PLAKVSHGRLWPGWPAGRRRRVGDHEHVARGVTNHRLGNAADEESGYSGPPVSAEHEEVCAPILRLGDDLIGRVAYRDRTLHGRSPVAQLRKELVQLPLGNLRDSGVLERRRQV